MPRSRVWFAVAVAAATFALLRYTGVLVPGYGLHVGRHGGWKLGTWLVLALQVMAVVEILRRADLPRPHQALWALAVLLVPVIGLLAYAVFGRRGCGRAGSGCCG